ncbi:MAG TPA: hypothetical protein PLD84_05515 [Chitinophagales bacterium]|nr:hypothetical protein [Chitinophagales bacterium]
MKIPDSFSHKTNFLLFVALFTCLLLAAFLLRFNGLYGQDAHEYLRLMRALGDYIKHGTSIAHSYFPIGYPLVALPLSGILSNDITVMQLVPMMALPVSFFYLKKLLQLIHEKASMVNSYLLAFFFFSPYVFRFGLLSMSDMLCLFFVIAAVYHSVGYSKLRGTQHAVLFGLFTAFAITTRYAAGVLLLLPALFLFRALLIDKDFKTVCFTLFAFCFPLIPDWLIRGRILFLDAAEKFTIDYASNAYTWSPLNFFRSTFQNPDGNQQYDFWNIVAVTFNVIHPAYLFAGFLFILFMKRHDIASPAMKLLLWMVIGYGLFIAGLQYQNNRYLLQSFPFLLVIFYPAFLRIVRQYFLKRRIQQLTFALIIFIQLLLFGYSFQKILLLNYTEQEISSSLQPYAGQTVYTCSITGALSSYQVQNPVIDLYFNRIPEPVNHSLLLFNYPEFSQYYAGRLPMVNWTVLNDKAHLRVIRSFPGGWSLYAVEAKELTP